MSPTFFLIGATKAGTTSLASLLAQHPQAAIVQGKEPHFFSLDSRYAMGWNAYLRLYSHCKGEIAVGDASTSYSRIRYYPATIDRIKRHCEDARIIYMVRNPLDRMVSAYVEHLSMPVTPYYTSLEEAIRLQPMILDSSRYWEVFDSYRSAFGESNVKVVWFEDYVDDTMRVLRDVSGFIGIDESFEPVLLYDRRNSRESVLARVAKLGRNVDMTLRPDTRKLILKQIRPDCYRLLRHFNRPQTQWSDLL